MPNTIALAAESSILTPAVKIATLRDLSHFLNSRVVNETMLSIVVAIVSVVLVVFCIFALKRYFLERKQSLFPLGWVTSESQIYQILSLMTEQNSTFEIQIDSEFKDKSSLIRCSPYGLSPKGLVVEGYGIAKQSRFWLGKDVSCYFKIKQAGQITFYAFIGRVQEIHVGDKEETYLMFDLPTKLQNRQKRSFLRIKPPSEYLLGAAIWNNACVPKDKIIGDIKLWPEPNYLLIPGQIVQFEVNDISAGGVRVTIPRAEADKNRDEFSLSDHVMLLIDLLSPEANGRMRFWVQCRVSNVSREQGSQKIELGVQFLSWAMPKDGETINVEWLRLTRDAELVPLGHWIVQRQLEQVRPISPAANWEKEVRDKKIKASGS